MYRILSDGTLPGGVYRIDVENGDRFLVNNGVRTIIIPHPGPVTSDADIYSLWIETEAGAIIFMLKVMPLTVIERSIYEKSRSLQNVGDVSGLRLIEPQLLLLIGEKARLMNFPNIAFCIKANVIRITNPEQISSYTLRNFFIVARVVDDAMNIVGYASGITNPNLTQSQIMKLSRRCGRDIAKKSAEINSSRRYCGAAVMMVSEWAGISLNDVLSKGVTDVMVKSTLAQCLICLSFLKERAGLLHLDAHLGNFLVRYMEPTTGKYLHYRRNTTNLYVPFAETLVSMIDFAGAAQVTSKVFDFVGYFDTMYRTFYDRKPKALPNEKSSVACAHMIDAIRATTIMLETDSVKALGLHDLQKRAKKFDDVFKRCDFDQMAQYTALSMLVEIMPELTNKPSEEIINKSPYLF